MWMHASAFKAEGACKLTEHAVSKELLEPLVVDGTIRRRSRDEILRSLDLFTVVERESRVRPPSPQPPRSFASLHQVVPTAVASPSQTVACMAGWHPGQSVI